MPAGWKTFQGFSDLFQNYFTERHQKGEADLKLELGFGFQFSGFGCRTLRARAQVLKGLVLVIEMVIRVFPRV